MDVPGRHTPQIFSSSMMGQNNHLNGHNIVTTLATDAAARRAQRRDGRTHPGQGFSHPVRGNMGGHLPPHMTGQPIPGPGFVATLRGLFGR
jgi:hypothetical protein